MAEPGRRRRRLAAETGQAELGTRPGSEPRSRLPRSDARLTRILRSEDSDSELAPGTSPRSELQVARAWAPPPTPGDSDPPEPSSRRGPGRGGGGGRRHRRPLAVRPGIAVTAGAGDPARPGQKGGPGLSLSPPAAAGPSPGPVTRRPRLCGTLAPPAPPGPVSPARVGQPGAQRTHDDIPGRARLPAARESPGLGRVPASDEFPGRRNLKCRAPERAESGRPCPGPRA